MSGTLDGGVPARRFRVIPGGGQADAPPPPQAAISITLGGEIATDVFTSYLGAGQTSREVVDAVATTLVAVELRLGAELEVSFRLRRVLGVPIITAQMVAPALAEPPPRQPRCE